jgi:type IV pilus assembly protein PilM
LFRRQKTVLGLDLGTQVLKAVELSIEGSEPVLTAFARVEIPPGGDRTRALAELFAAAPFRARSVVGSVAGQAVVVRYIPMVDMPDAELRQAIHFEIDKYLPFEKEEVVLDFQRLSRRPAGQERQVTVVLVACRNAVLDQMAHDVQSHGYTPTAIDVDTLALANAFELAEQLAGAAPRETPTALIDIGAARTQINVVAGGETCFSREIGIGGSDMTQAVARRLSIDPAEAESVKCNPGERHADVARAIVPVLEDLVSELSLSLDYVESREGLGVEEILVSGGGSLAPGAVEFIASATGRAVRTWSPVGALRVAGDRVRQEDLEAAAPSLAVAVGLASRIRAA